MITGIGIVITDVGMVITRCGATPPASDWEAGSVALAQGMIMFPESGIAIPKRVITKDRYPQLRSRSTS